MRTIRSILSVAALLLVSSAAVEAHPGHSHADLFAVLRQPLAGWQHALITAMAALTIGVAVHLITHATRTPAHARWAASIGATFGAAWLLR